MSICSCLYRHCQDAPHRLGECGVSVLQTLPHWYIAWSGVRTMAIDVEARQKYFPSTLSAFSLFALLTNQSASCFFMQHALSNYAWSAYSPMGTPFDKIQHTCLIVVCKALPVQARACKRSYLHICYPAWTTGSVTRSHCLLFYY